MRRSIAVTIAGQRYTIRSDADESYVHGLASLVEGKIKSVQRASKIAAPQAVAVLAALQLADELERERARRAGLRDRVKAQSRAIRDYLDREVKS
jgi:cell division protein ZapA